jgi:hypothetical protein
LRIARAFLTWSEKVSECLRFKVYVPNAMLVAGVDCFLVYLKLARAACCPAKCRSNAEGADGGRF